MAEIQTRKREIGEIMLAVYFIEVFSRKCSFMQRTRESKEQQCIHFERDRLFGCTSVTCPLQSDLIKACENDFEETFNPMQERYFDR